MPEVISLGLEVAKSPLGKAGAKYVAKRAFQGAGTLGSLATVYNTAKPFYDAWAEKGPKRVKYGEPGYTPGEMSDYMDPLLEYLPGQDVEMTTAATPGQDTLGHEEFHNMNYLGNGWTTFHGEIDKNKDGMVTSFYAIPWDQDGKPPNEAFAGNAAAVFTYKDGKWTVNPQSGVPHSLLDGLQEIADRLTEGHTIPGLAGSVVTVKSARMPQDATWFNRAERFKKLPYWKRKLIKNQAIKLGAPQLIRKLVNGRKSYTTKEIKVSKSLGI